MLIGNGISKKYNSNVALNETDINVPDGKIIVIIGPSGAGKSTLLKLLSLAEESDSGNISLGDKKYVFPLSKNKKINYPYPNISLVFQQLFLWPHLTLRENIVLSIKKNKEFPTKKLNDLLDFLDMASFTDRYPNEVSLGQRQRAALVRSLIMNPKILLLDEITSALDVEQIKNICLILKSLKSQGVGIVIVTHLLNLAMEIGDRIMFMNKGKICEQGDKSILKNPRSHELKKFLSNVVLP
jgi:ABC-type polar amino acid transport system ATPase subunit